MTSANQLSNMIAHDPQMQLPVRPVLSPDYLKIWVSSDRLIICGTQHDVALRGRSVSKILPTLLPLLNGHHTIEDICQQIPNLSEQSIRDTLSLLYMRGLLGDGAGQELELKPEARKFFAPQATFYGRYVDITRKLKNGYQAIQRLQTGAVTVIGDGYIGIEAVLEFVALGIGHVQIVGNYNAEEQEYIEKRADFSEVTFTDLASLNVTSEQPDLLIYVASEADFTRLQMLNALATEQGIPFIGALLNPDHIEVGPVYYPQSSPCYECAYLQQTLQWHVPDEQNTALSLFENLVTPEQRIGLGRLILTVSSALTQITTPHNCVVFRFDPATFTWNEYPVLDLKACPACSVPLDHYGLRNLPIGPDHLENLPTLYHHNTRVKLHEMNPRGHQVHYREDVIKTVKGARKSYDGVKRIPLTETEIEPDAWEQSYVELWRNFDRKPDAKHVTTFDDLSLWLRTVAEVKAIKAGKMTFQKRVTPSGGNLLSQGLYLVNLGFEAFEQGIYHFRSDGVLEQLRTGDFHEEIQRASITEAGFPDSIRAVLLITNSMGRIESKYGGRALFFSMLDAGVMLHSLRYVARLLDIDVEQALNFYDDQFNQLLGFYTPNEIVSAMMYLK